MGEERANGKVWGGIGVSFGKDWADCRLWVRLGGLGIWVRFGEIEELGRLKNRGD